MTTTAGGAVVVLVAHEIGAPIQRVTAHVFSRPVARASVIARLSG